MLTEADTCRKYVSPKLYATGRTDGQSIVAELDALREEMDRLNALQADTAAKFDALLPAILDRAFKGEL